MTKAYTISHEAFKEILGIPGRILIVDGLYINEFKDPEEAMEYCIDNQVDPDKVIYFDDNRKPWLVTKFFKIEKDLREFN